MHMTYLLCYDIFPWRGVRIHGSISGKIKWAYTSDYRNNCVILGILNCEALNPIAHWTPIFHHFRWHSRNFVLAVDFFRVIPPFTGIFSLLQRSESFMPDKKITDSGPNFSKKWCTRVSVFLGKRVYHKPGQVRKSLFCSI